ncbi:uncharacterized protein LOC109523293 isoform X2 [Hippocampus comes]|uniref:uncharacterized protein LOC109523293 isoform X2 n=1 Tax=Hippocampus comes TaxID=109280 RepID=UPI00094E8F04|nr:PREDICTED: uncharacterized protein LOC109523293 isoform X2 [Hippocampus comes]
MAYQRTPGAIDSLLCRLVIEVRELSQKKNDIDREVEVHKANIAERRTYIETTRTQIKVLEEGAEVKHNTLKHNRAVIKSMKVTQGLLLQYERTLRAELESVKANYDNDKEGFKDKITSYRKLFQAHQKPFAQTLQAQNDDMESPTMVSHDDVPVKTKEGGRAHVTDSDAPRSSSEQRPDSAEADVGMESSPVKDSMAVVSTVNISDMKGCPSGPETSADGNAEEMDVQSEARASLSCSADETRSSEQHVGAQDHHGPDEMPGEEEDDQEVQPLSQAKQSPVSEEKEAARAQMEERAPAEKEEQAPQQHGVLSLPQGQQVQPQSSTTPGTPTFHFNFSPTSSPVEGTSGSKSPAFMFSLNSNPSTPGYSSFSFDGVPSHDEDLSFPFGGSFFNDKKNQETKSGGLDFLFNQPEQSEDFQFPFTSESPADNKENTTTDFPFSFNF